MFSTNKVVLVEDTFICCKDYTCQVSELQQMYVIGLTPLSALDLIGLAWHMVWYIQYLW